MSCPNCESENWSAFISGWLSFNQPDANVVIDAQNLIDKTSGLTCDVCGTQFTFEENGDTNVGI